MEPRDHGLEHQANVRPQPRLRRGRSWPKWASRLSARAPPGDFTPTAEVDNTANRTERLQNQPERNFIERFFNKLKHFRDIATRYDKLPKTFLAGVYLACAAILLN